MALPSTLWQAPAGTSGIPQTMLPISSTNPLPVVGGGVAAGSIYEGNGNIPSTATTITFGVLCSTVKISLSSGSANLYVNRTGIAATGTSADYIIYSGTSDVYNGRQLASISILGASASGTYSIEAY
jgi:hypothetical protein